MNNFFTELRRRNIFRVAGVYAVVGWILMQVVSVMTPALNLPDWVDSFFAVALLIGFPIALLLAWAFEMTPEGVKPAGAMAEATSAAAKPVRALDYVIVGALVLVGALVIWQGLRTAPFEAAKNEAPQSLPRTGSGDEGAGVVKKDLHPEGSPQAIASKDGGAEQANTPSPASIAVLPFADLSPNKDQAYFSDGMAEEILNVLVRVDGMKVASRTSSFQFKGRELGIPEIANQLNVRHVLEGSVRKSGTTIRITAQLIDAQTDQHLWSQTYDRTLSTENIFAIQDEIANEIVKQLGIKIGGASPATPKVRVAAGTENLDAYELYLKGRALFVRRGKDNLAKAARTLEEAVRIDAGFARAWGDLSGVYVISENWGRHDRDYTHLAIKAANEALRLNPDLSMPYATLGFANMNLIAVEADRTWDISFDNISKAIDRDPKNATAYFWRGIIYLDLGFFDRAITDMKQCFVLDPALENCRRWMAIAYLYSDPTEEALRLFEEGLESGFFARNLFFAATYAAQGKNVAALALLAQSFEDDQPHMIKTLYRALSDPAFSDADRREALTLMRPVATAGPNDMEVHILLGDYGWLPLPTVNNGNHWYRGDPAFLKSEGRKAQIRYWRLPEHWRKNGFPPQCRAVGTDDFECD
jgi:TolB-like protein/tetratricopeptide (TPR) repeat protein